MGDKGRIYFEYQFDEASPKVSMTLSPEADLFEVLEAFENFLRGAGYAFYGEIDINTEGEDNEPTESSSN